MTSSLRLADGGLQHAHRRAGLDMGDLALWMFNHIVSTQDDDDLSMLFGAGLVFDVRPGRRQGVPRSERSTTAGRVLLLIGLVHAYLIWDGDISFRMPFAGFSSILSAASLPGR